MSSFSSICVLLLLLLIGYVPSAQDIRSAGQWVTSPDRQKLLSYSPLRFDSKEDNQIPVIRIFPDSLFQTVDGFGFTLTGGSAELIHRMDSSARAALLTELFTLKQPGIGISCLRISMGASDLSSRVFSYDDLPTGVTDFPLSNFSLSDDTLHLIPLLREILKINPRLFIMASPWSAPAWMKTNKSSKGGKLDKTCYDVYARYMVRYMLEMKKLGIDIAAITLQNEPHHGGNNPSMVMEPEDQALLVGEYLGPLMRSHHLNTRIVIWDHNCDEPEYPIQVLQDPKAYPYIDGSAFHLYGGKIDALSTVKTAFPEKNLYFTEQWTGKDGSFAGDLQWHISNVVIGSLKNWSKMALEWNLANDPGFGPHTPGGCTACKGALTISGNSIERNVAYYIIAHASGFIPPGSVRVASSEPGGLQHVAFRRPDGRLVMLILNEEKQERNFRIDDRGRMIAVSIAQGEVMTLVL